MAQVWTTNGNLQSDGTNTYTYDSENRLTQAVTPGGTTTYGYDPLGRRVRKTVMGVVTRMYYDGDQRLVEASSTGVQSAKYLFGPGIDEPLRMIRGATTAWYHADGLGNISELTNATGTVTETYRYEAYGRPQAASTVGNPFLFTGREYDAETSLYHYRARAYSPTLGRFLQRDPLKTGEINKYSYVRNAPITATDPHGLYTVIIHGVDTHFSTPYQHGYSGNLGRELQSQGEQVQEVIWSGFELDVRAYAQVSRALMEAAAIAASRGEPLNVISHSWGSVLAGEVIHGTGIKVDNLITMGSPYTDFSNIGTRWMNLWSPLDPISWGSAIAGISNPNQYEIYSGLPHMNYWDNARAIDRVTEFLDLGKGAKCGQ